MFGGGRAAQARERALGVGKTRGRIRCAQMSAEDEGKIGPSSISSSTTYLLASPRYHGGMGVLRTGAFHPSTLHHVLLQVR